MILTLEERDLLILYPDIKVNAEKYVLFNGIRNRMIVARQEHDAQMKQLRSEMCRLGCDHRIPSGSLVDWNGRCVMCDAEVAQKKNEGTGPQTAQTLHKRDPQ